MMPSENRKMTSGSVMIWLLIDLLSFQNDFSTIDCYVSHLPLQSVILSKNETHSLDIAPPTEENIAAFFIIFFSPNLFVTWSVIFFNRTAYERWLTVSTLVIDLWCASWPGQISTGGQMKNRWVGQAFPVHPADWLTDCFLLTSTVIVLQISMLTDNSQT